jgi:hypothetical protein
MKITILSAFAALTLMTVAARAEGGEGNGDPFPFRLTGPVIVTQPDAAFAGAARVLSLPQPGRRAIETAQAPSTTFHR